MRSSLVSSPLVRLLGRWTPVEGDAAGADVAERLSLWVSAFDAIGLQAAQQSIRTVQTALPGKRLEARPAGADALAAELQRVRATLARAVAQDLPDAAETEVGYAPYQQRHLELQRRMALAITPLRDHVRHTLSRMSPRLRQLAALDAMLEQVVAPREQQLLQTVPALMQRRYEQRRREAGDWQESFGKDWRELLLAEVDLRLEPVAGLIEALGNEFRNRQ